LVRSLRLKIIKEDDSMDKKEARKYKGNYELYS
jgi:hypothetical protein